jgi:ATP-dependent helicase/nuclease subunit A
VIPPYLDVGRSVIISSPAGSGKTEKLARRYIALLEQGAGLPRILAITFTEKAAAEMKERIIAILGRENPALLRTVRPDLPLMRISTIHAFCLKLLKRFSMELGLDPSLDVIDDIEAGALWNEALFEGLIAERGERGDLFHMMVARGFRGWGTIKRSLESLHNADPYPELLLAAGAPPEGEAGRLLLLYRDCLVRYKAKKAARRVLDFSDIELLAARALDTSPEWQNILYIFDEHTDHVLVDEFQDTSTLQWRIVDKLTEEWRAGAGAKRERGSTPTVFLVGDTKQSIYLFRGASAGVFDTARERFRQWMGDDYLDLEAGENYRSMPAIVEFVNRLFERLMPQTSTGGWVTRYAPFAATRSGIGKVELLLTPADGPTRELRTGEARALAARILSLRESFGVAEGAGDRPATFADMAVLLRKRTHLGAYENAFREYGIPFVVLKGIGFYEAPETALMRDLVSFVADPSDDYATFSLLRSPLFGVSYAALAALGPGGAALIERAGRARPRRLREAAATLMGWADQARTLPLAPLIEDTLTERAGWSIFHEPERHANLKKFIRLIEGWEAAGAGPLELRERLLRLRTRSEIAKANVNVSGVDAVRIMTIHAAKGLQFPIVFLPSMDEKIEPRSDPITIDEGLDGELAMDFEEDSSARKKRPRFELRRLKELEEEKRLFYVAATRAMDALVMSGAEVAKTEKTRLGYIEAAFPSLDAEGLPFDVVRAGETGIAPPARHISATSRSGLAGEPAYPEPLGLVPRLLVRDVTKDTEALRGHGPDAVVIGRVMHRLLEEIAKGMTAPEGVESRALTLLRAESTRLERLTGPIAAQMAGLAGGGIMESVVVARGTRGWAELPIVLETEGVIYRGRIDRLIVRDGRALVYDYKTYPVADSEVADLVRVSSHQLGVYREAVRRILGLPAETWLVLTDRARLVPVGTAADISGGA